MFGPLDFRLLGPLEVRDADRSLPLGGRKQRTLLAILLLHANEVVSSDALIDGLWGERAPKTAGTALQIYVSTLRKLLSPERLETRTPGYLLHVEPEELDLTRFERLAAEASGGDAEAAASALTEALKLWRGQPLADFAHDSFAQGEIARLEELRLAAIEQRIDAELQLGRHAELVAELEALVAGHPLRERLRAQLMLALYRCRRQAEALEAYRQARQTFVKELGIEPGRELKALEQAILRHDDALDLRRLPSEKATAEEDRDPHAPARRQWLVARRAIPVAVVLLLTTALGLAFGLGSKTPALKLLSPNSVGFIDAGSGRVTRSVSVGRKPLALTMAFGSLWVAEYADKTVSRIDRATGRRVADIPVGGHPTGLTGYRGRIWVWTMEGLLVAIDPRYDNARRKIQLPVQPPGGPSTGAGLQERRRLQGRIAAAGGFLWLTVPETTLIQVNAANPRRYRAFIPDDGAQGPIASHARLIWVGGFEYVTPIDARAGIPGSAIAVGRVRALSFGFGTLWVASGSEAPGQGVRTALRRLDLRGQLPQAEVRVGSNLTAVAVAAGSIWAASASNGTILRVDPRKGQVLDTIRVGPSPTDLAPDGNGVWVAVD